MTPPARPVAVVTGAAGGLGRAIAAALHADGWSVLLTDLDAGGGAGRRCAARRLVGRPGRPGRGRLRRRRRERGRPGRPRPLGKQRRHPGHRAVVGARRRDPPPGARGERPRRDERHPRRAGGDARAGPRPRAQRRLAGRAGRRARRDGVRGQQARPAGVQPRHPGRPADGRAPAGARLLPVPGRHLDADAARPARRPGGGGLVHRIDADRGAGGRPGRSGWPAGHVRWSACPAGGERRYACWTHCPGWPSRSPRSIRAAGRAGQRRQRRRSTPRTGADHRWPAC